MTFFSNSPLGKLNPKSFWQLLLLKDFFLATPSSSLPFFSAITVSAIFTLFLHSLCSEIQKFSVPPGTYRGLGRMLDSMEIILAISAFKKLLKLYFLLSQFSSGSVFTSPRGITAGGDVGESECQRNLHFANHISHHPTIVPINILIHLTPDKRECHIKIDCYLM